MTDTIKKAAKPRFETAIVLINYNNIKDTNECIESVRNSSAELPFVVVLDNASKDGPNFNNNIISYPHLHIIINNTNIGFGRANNMAMDWVFDNIDCKYIFILNNDTILTDNLIQQLIQGINLSSENVAMATPRIMVYSNPEEVWYGGGDINYNKMTAVINTAPYDSNNKLSMTDFASGCAMLFKTEVLKQLKGFDPFYFMYDEDVELSIRIKNSGYKILYVADSVLYHKCQGSQIKYESSVPNNQLHPNHPGLLFYLKNTITNRRYTLKKHLRNDKLKVYFFFNFYWLLKSIQYIIYRNFKAFSITLSGLLKAYNEDVHFNTKH